MKDFAGKVAFITGGASGAGFGQAKVFAEAGCKVVIADLRQDHLDQAMEYFRSKNAEVYPVQLDVTDREAYKAAADEVEEVYGSPPQLLVNTAGVNAFGPAEASTFEDFDWIVGVNLGGVINGMVIFVPRMIKAGYGGHIATTSSWAAFMGGAIVAPYSAAKAAVNNLMESYYLSLRPYGIGVTVLCPQNIKSNIGEAVYTRPEHLKKSGYNMGESTVEFLRSFHAEGMDPVELANWLKEGIENEQLYVIPYENSTEMLQENFQRIIDMSTPEGMRKQEKILEQKMKEREKQLKETTFGKAKKDIDWVDENKK